MSQVPSLNIRRMVFISLFTALIIVGGYISFPIPLSPVPIVLADFFAMFAGLILGASSGGTSVGLFLFLGALGLPVFAGGKSGLAVLFGPTGGFLFAYLISAIVVGLISHKGKSSLLKNLTALITGNIIIFSIGVPWLKLILKLQWGKALALGLLPFTPGAVIKIIIGLSLSQALHPLLQQMTDNSSYKELEIK